MLFWGLILGGVFFGGGGIVLLVRLMRGVDFQGNYLTDGQRALLNKAWGTPIVIGVVAFVLAAHVYAPAPEPTTDDTHSSVVWQVEGQFSQIQLDTLSRMLQKFQELCQGFYSHPDAVLSASVRLIEVDEPAIHYRAETYGWKQYLAIEIVLGEGLGLPNAWRADGHHIFYNLGGGDHPGIEIVKDQSYAFFFRRIIPESKQGANQFVAAPEFLAVDEL